MWKFPYHVDRLWSAQWVLEEERLCPGPGAEYGLIFFGFNCDFLKPITFMLEVLGTF